VVVEERPDGSLVLAPEESRGSRRAQRRMSEVGNTLLSGMLFTPKQPPTTIPAALDDWGVDLGEDELVREFLVADVDGRTGFVAVTSQRILFLVNVGRELGIAQAQLLSSARGVDLVRRGVGHKLRVRGDGFEMLIGVSDRGSLARLQQALAVQNR
jgi:hypothetical protein